MTSIQWKEAPEKPLRSGTVNDSADSEKNDPWFGLSLCLLGVIGGYLLATFL